MYQSSEAFGNLVLQDSRTFKALITYDDVSITNAKSIKFTGGAEGEDDFSLGSTVSQYVTIIIPDPGKAIEGHELLVQIGMEVNGLVEYIPMGYFTPGKPSRNEEQIEFTAYDRMMKTERAFSMDGDSTDTAAVLKRIQEITGVMVVTDGLSGISMKVPKGYSCREVLYLSEVGHRTSTDPIRPSLRNSSAVPIAWMVFPRPISSAIIAFPAFAAKRMPSFW